MNTHTTWGWLPPPDEGIWRYGAAWMRPLCAAAPWLTLVLLAVLLVLASGRFSVATGVAFDLPETHSADTVPTRLVALVMRLAPEAGSAEGTYVFFEDSRYALSDPASAAQFAEAVGERLTSESSGALMLLVDVGVPTGDLMNLTALARHAGVKRVLCAEKRRER